MAYEAVAPPTPLRRTASAIIRTDPERPFRTRSMAWVNTQPVVELFVSATSPFYLGLV